MNNLPLILALAFSIGVLDESRGDEQKVVPPCCRVVLPTGPVSERSLYQLDSKWVSDVNREIILGALTHTHDNATEAAKLLDLERGHFYKKMKALGLKRAGGETSSADPG